MEFMLINCLLATATGVLLHRGYFIYGEHDRHADTIARIALLALGVVFFYYWRGQALPATQATRDTILTAGAFCGGLFGSITFSRLFWSPIQHLPGPFWAKVSKLYHVAHIIRADNYRYMDKLHHEYGDIVRTGMLLGATG